MKNILAVIIGVAAVTLAAITSNAQNGQPYSDFQVIPIQLVYTAGTTNYSMINAPQIGVINQQNLAMVSTMSAAAAGATNQYFFAPSCDGIIFDTNVTDCVIWSNSVPYTIAPGQNTKFYSFATGGARYYKLIQVVTLGTATNGSVLATNTALQGNSFGYANKISCP